MKSKTLPQLEKILWKYFSLYIRIKDANSFGLVGCYTCPAIKHYKEMQAGHFIKRSYKAIKYDIRNVKPQCPRCNMFMDGNQDEFAVRLERELGHGILQKLHKLKWQEKRFTRIELNNLIEEYKAKVKNLPNYP